MSQRFDVIICGAGSIGVAASYYLAQQKGMTNVLLVDKHAPLSQTSAKSGENYRNWWPQEVMVRFTNRSIDLMEALAQQSGNVFQMSRRGYAYVSSETEAPAAILGTVDHYAQLDVGEVRIHERTENTSYRFSPWLAFAEQPDGADVLLNQGLIRQTFAHFAHDVQAVVHARRCGAISAQQLGIYLLEQAKQVGVQELPGEVCGVEQDADGVSAVLVKTAEGREFWQAEPAYHWLLNQFPGGLHIKPEGGQNSQWIKLGWAFNQSPKEPLWQREGSAGFLDVMLRGAAMPESCLN